MNKTELIDDAAHRSDAPKATAAKVVDATLLAIEHALRHGRKIELKGFGTFEVTHTPARMGRNPATGEAIEIKAGKRVKFKPSRQILG